MLVEDVHLRARLGPQGNRARRLCAHLDGVVQIFQVDLACTLDNLASFTDAPTWYGLLTDVLAGLDRAELAERIRLIPNLPDPPPESFRETHVLAQAPAVRSAAAAAAAVRADLATVQAGLASAETGLRASSAAELAATLRSLPQHAVKDTIIANKAIVGPVPVLAHPRLVVLLAGTR